MVPDVGNIQTSVNRCALNAGKYRKVKQQKEARDMR